MDSSERQKMMALHARARAQYQRQQPQQDSFQNLNASQLYCPTCKRATPVREKMLLSLPTGDLIDYVCAQCGTTTGKKTS